MARKGLREDVTLKRGLKDHSVQGSANFFCGRTVNIFNFVDHTVCPFSMDIENAVKRKWSTVQ